MIMKLDILGSKKTIKVFICLQTRPNVVHIKIMLTLGSSNFQHLSFSKFPI